MAGRDLEAAARERTLVESALAAAGVRATLAQIVNTPVRLTPEAVTALLDLLAGSRLTDTGVIEMVVRGLTTREAQGPRTVRVLIEVFRAAAGDPTGLQWAAANALGVVSTRADIDEIAALLADRSHGRGRERLVEAIARMKDPRVFDTLVSVLDDPTVNGHAVLSLSRKRDPRIPALLEPFMSDWRPWVSKAAKRVVQRARHAAEAAPITE